MRNFFTTRIRVVIVIAALCALVTMGFIILRPGKASPMNNAVSVVMTPVKSATSLLVRRAENLYNYIFGYELLEAENEQLRVVMSQQNQDIRNSQSYKQENEHLRALLSLQDKHTDFVFEIANVVSWDSSSYGSVMTISKGSSSGLEAGMCAITADGQVLGLITETGSSWATVTTILDTTSEIGSYIFGSGYSCIAQGNFELMRQGTLRASYISSSATIRNGDQLLTSGDGDIYPAGLVIGTVSDVGDDEINVAKYAVVTPMVNPATVEQVFVIKSFDVND